MNINSLNPSDKDFEYFSSNLGFSVSVIIHPPTDERLKNGLNFLDPDQILPLAPFLGQAALEAIHPKPRNYYAQLQAGKARKARAAKKETRA